MPSPKAEILALAWRGPPLVMATLGLLIVFAVGYGLILITVTGALGMGPQAASGLLIPAFAATALTGFEAWSGLRRETLTNLRSAALRGARGWGAVGLAWPLAWSASAALEGQAGGAVHALLPAGIGLFAGAVAGAAAGAAAAASVMRTVRAAPPPG